MTREQHAALMWAMDNLTGEAQHRFAAFILDLDEHVKENDKPLLEKYTNPKN